MKSTLSFPLFSLAALVTFGLGLAPGLLRAEEALFIMAQSYDQPGFLLRLGLKDIRLALQASEAAGVSMPFASVLRDNFLDAIGHGDGERDLAALATVSARRSGQS